jgi:hypothetical protein
VFDVRDPTKLDILTPTDNSADATGFFPCGGEHVYSETKDFVFPDFVCTECTLQWILKVDEVVYYQCADITIQSTLFDWGYEDDDEEAISVTGYFVMFVTFVACISFLACVVYYCFNQSKLPNFCQNCIKSLCPFMVREDRYFAQTT